MTRIKICGLRSVRDAEEAVAAGADALGVVLAPARRQVTLNDVRAIRGVVPPIVPLVGVFVDPTPEDVTAALDAGVDVLQFSGDEPPEFCASFARPFIKVVRVGNAAPAPEDVTRYRVGMVTFDTAHGEERGGTGRTFNWSKVTPLRGLVRFCIAGGLRPENVGEAVRTLRPFAVDVSSGVERDGRKDPTLMRAFVRAVRESDATA